MTPKQERAQIYRKIQDNAMAISRAQLLIFLLKQKNDEHRKEIEKLKTK